jgi:hypothetical protein
MRTTEVGGLNNCIDVAASTRNISLSGTATSVSGKLVELLSMVSSTDKQIDASNFVIEQNRQLETRNRSIITRALETIGEIALIDAGIDGYTQMLATAAVDRHSRVAQFEQSMDVLTESYQKVMGKQFGEKETAGMKVLRFTVAAESLAGQALPTDHEPGKSFPTCLPASPIRATDVVRLHIALVASNVDADPLT